MPGTAEGATSSQVDVSSDVTVTSPNPRLAVYLDCEQPRSRTSSLFNKTTKFGRRVSMTLRADTSMASIVPKSSVEVLEAKIV